MVSNSLINAALSAKKTERALISAASTSDFFLDVFSMTIPAKLPLPLYCERPGLPPASEICQEMMPRARPKHGRLPAVKSKRAGDPDDAEDTENRGSCRPGTSGSSKQTQGAIKDFLKQRGQAIINKEAATKPAVPQGRRSTALFKKVGKVAGVFGASRNALDRKNSEVANGTQSNPASRVGDDGFTGAGTGDGEPGENMKQLRRRGTMAPVNAEAALKHTDIGDRRDLEEQERRPFPGFHNDEFDHEFFRAFKPKGSLDDRLKRLDTRRNERAKEERSRLRHENRLRRFNELPAKEREALTEAFKRFDIDNSGYLDHGEVIACLREFGLSGTTAPEKRDILSVCVEASVSDDDDPNPVITVRRPEDVSVDLYDLALTVVPCVRQVLTELRSDHLLKEFFKFDEDGSGKLSRKEMKELARGMGLPPSMIGETGDGADNAEEVDFETFQEMIVLGREQLERACREKERHVQRIAYLSESAFQKFRRDLVTLYDVFVRHDTDGSEHLSKLELMFMLQESGLAPRSPHEKEDMKVIFFEHDHTDGSNLPENQINFNDFLEIVYEIRHYREEQIKEVQLDRFSRYDYDKSGSLTINEISIVLADLQLTPTNRVEQEEIGNLIAAVDLDGSGYIDFVEFQDLSQRIDEKLRSFRYEEEIEFAMCLGFSENQMRDLRQVFVSLDQDCSQKLDADEVRIGLAMMNKHVTHKVFEETFRSLDTDGSGELDFTEFLQFMKMIVDSQGPIGNQEDAQKLAQKPKDLDTRILRRVLEYFRLAKNYIQSLTNNDLVSLFCEYLGVKPEANLHLALEVKTVGELYQLAQDRDLALQSDSAVPAEGNQRK